MPTFDHHHRKRCKKTRQKPKVNMLFTFYSFNFRMQGPPDLRIAITLLILLGVFILCWTPAIILVITNLAESEKMFHPIALLVVTVAIFTVPACNPVVYSLRNTQFRSAANEFLESVVNVFRSNKP